MVAERFSIEKRKILHIAVAVASDETTNKRLKLPNFLLEPLKLTTTCSIVLYIYL